MNERTRIGNHVLACPRRRVAKLRDHLPTKWIERLEHDQTLKSCCRHPENHVIEAWFSGEFERNRGTPDIYKIICTGVHKNSIRANGEREHVFFCVTDGERPFWQMWEDGE